MLTDKLNITKKLSKNKFIDFISLPTLNEAQSRTKGRSR